jgi:hypothetical protein
MSKTTKSTIPAITEAAKSASLAVRAFARLENGRGRSSCRRDRTPRRAQLAARLEHRSALGLDQGREDHCADRGRLVRRLDVRLIHASAALAIGAATTRT